MSGLLPVIQADRDAVQAFHRTMAKRLMSDLVSERPKLGEDEGDAGTLVQAFARHRLSATTPGADLLEQARERQRIVAWLRAQSEVGAEIGVAAEKGTTRRAAYGGGSLALKRAADAVEAGDHCALSPARDGAGS